LVTNASRKMFSIDLFDVATGSFTTSWTDVAAAAAMGSIQWVDIFLFAQR
jgi:hypothetical protein